MKSGPLDRTIALMQPGAASHNGYTSKPGEHTSAGTRKAHLMPASPSEQFELQGRVALKRAQFMVRSDSLTRTITATWKLVYKTVTYDIVGVTEQGRNDGLLIEAVADDRVQV